MKMLKLAVIGKDVSKSLSPRMHTFIASQMGHSVEYGKISLPQENFDKEIDSIIAAYDGLNVTIPYKLTVMSRLQNIEGDAGVFGAVNTVICRSLSGYNTDGSGFMLMLRNNGVNASGKKVLVLGAGGAGRSVAKKLSDDGAKVFVYDKNVANAKAVADEFAGVTALDSPADMPYFLIVNATGVGMHNTEGISPVGEGLLGLCEVAVDLIYTPKQSEFLRIAKSLGKKVINGEAMLFYQAYYAECLFVGRVPDDGEAKRLFEKFSSEEI